MKIPNVEVTGPERSEGNQTRYAFGLRLTGWLCGFSIVNAIDSTRPVKNGSQKENDEKNRVKHPCKHAQD